MIPVTLSTGFARTDYLGTAMPQRTAIRRLEVYEEPVSSYDEEPPLRRQIVAGIAVAFLATILAASVFSNQLLFHPQNVRLLLLVVATGVPLGLLAHTLTRTCQVLLRAVVFALAGGLAGLVLSAFTLSGVVLPTFVALGFLAGASAGCWAAAVARYRTRLRVALGMVAFASVGPVVVYQFV